MLNIHKEEIIFFGSVFFLGLTFGWFCRKFNPIMIIIGLCIFAPILDFLMAVDHWILTTPFVLGFLVHTAKPIYNKLIKNSD